MTDQDAVRVFEAHVHHQEKPAAWAPVTPWDLESRRKAEGEHPRLIRDVFKPKRVLDYGCGPGCLVALLSELGVRVWGYEPNDEIRKQVPHYVEHLVHHHCGNNFGDNPYDLVICREVLEHCTILQIPKIVRELVRMSNKFVYVTTRYCQAPRHFLDYDTSDALDPTHVTMLNKEFLRTLFVLEGCKSRPDLEARMDWKNLGRCLVFEVA